MRGAALGSLLTRLNHLSRLVIVKPELLDDLIWILQDPARQSALYRSWDELQHGNLIRPPKEVDLNVRSLRTLVRQFPAFSKLFRRRSSLEKLYY